MESIKHIITSGCSFTRQEHRLGFNGTDTDFLKDAFQYWRWPHHIQTEYENYKVYNLGNPTNDNGVIAHSAIKKISDLLKEGISPNDIKVIIQWSEQGRNSFFISNQVAQDFGGLAKDRHENDRYDVNRWSHLAAFAEKDHFKERFGYYLLTGNYYPTSHIEYPTELIELHAKYYSHQESAIRFFTNIILLQNFCKVNNINELFMFNLSYNFFIDKEPNIFETVEQVYIDKKIPSYKTNFTTTNPYISYLYESIDFDKIWFYEDKNTNVGGQLEWAVANFDYKTDKRLCMEHDYVETDLHDYCNTFPSDNPVGHVSSEMNRKFVKVILKEFLEK